MAARAEDRAKALQIEQYQEHQGENDADIEPGKRRLFEL
jgi:hypothetical protein